MSRGLGDVYKRQVLIMDSDHVVLSAVAPETVGGRAAVDEEDDDNV